MNNDIKIEDPEKLKKLHSETPCMWTPENYERHFHSHDERAPYSFKIKDTILDAIGYTPLVRLHKIPQSEGVNCEIVAKCEYLNPGGSLKDRPALRMITDAEKVGRIQPGDTFIEPTSGNTGIAMALVSAIKGYRMILVVPEKCSDEKVATMRSLGAEVVVKQTEHAWHSPETHISLSKKLHEQIPHSHILGQYVNPSNPKAHYDSTAEELIEQCEGKIDYFFAGAGTGGTISGIGHKLKEKFPGCKIIGVDPVGSLIALPEELNKTEKKVHFQVEGTGDEFIPKTLDRPVIDGWVKVNDKDSFLMARRLIKDEGLLCGGSAGLVVAGAIQYAKENKLGKDVRCVVLLADSIKNYMTKFIDDFWMIRHRFMSMESLSDPTHPLSGVSWEKLELKESQVVDTEVTLADVAKIMSQGVRYLPVVDQKKIVGLISHHSLMKQMINNKKTGDQPACPAVVRDIQIVNYNCFNDFANSIIT